MTSPPKPVLGDMPHNIFELIVEPLDFESRMNIGLCCKKFKAMSDMSIIWIRAISFLVESNKITFMAYQNNVLRYTFVYSPAGPNKTLVTFTVEDGARRRVHSYDLPLASIWRPHRASTTWNIESKFTDCSLKRLQMFLDNPKFNLDTFDVRFLASTPEEKQAVGSVKSKLLNLFEKATNNKRLKFNVKEFKLTSEALEKDALEILPFMKPIKMGKLELDSGKQRNEWIGMLWDTMTSSDYFKGLRCFKATNCWTITPLQKFDHLTSLDIRVSNVLLDDYEWIVEKMLNAKRLHFWTILFTYAMFDPRIIDEYRNIHAPIVVKFDRKDRQPELYFSNFSFYRHHLNRL